MRNKYPGTCYRCGKHCAAGDGHFERVIGKGWRVQHASCAIEHRGTDHSFDQPKKQAGAGS
jgi:hypothetical protein